MMPEFIYYVYSYLREDLTPYYIGKGKGRRAWRHFKGEVMPPKDKSRIKIVAHKLTDSESRLLERSLISQYGRIDIGTGILRNKTDGGEGVSGRIVTKETRAKSKASNITTWQKDETKARHVSSMIDIWNNPIRNAKISASLSGEKNPRFGNLTPEERLARRRESNRKCRAKKKAAEAASLTTVIR